MKKLTLGLVVLAALALPAHAQKRGAEPTPEELQQRREAAQLDKQYKDTLKRTDGTATPAKVDPWANLRGNDSGTNKKR